MKSAMPYAGVAAPELRRLAAASFDAHPFHDAEAWRHAALRLWREARYREERYAALQLLWRRQYRAWLTPDLWDTLDECVVTGAWWDYIDTLAPNHYARLLDERPSQVGQRLRDYAVDDNFWRRRVAILCQLKRKTATDPALLFDAISASLEHQEFFVRKAIGWALRAHGRTDPDAVLAFVAQNTERLSPLSRREALKHLGGA